MPKTSTNQQASAQAETQPAMITVTALAFLEWDGINYMPGDSIEVAEDRIAELGESVQRQ